MKPVWSTAALGLALMVFVLPVGRADAGDIENNLSSYTGPNAQGYLEPLKNGIGSSLNSGLYSSAYIPRSGFNARIELRGMMVKFGDDERTFMAKTEDYFPDPQTVEAPTVIGDVNAVTVSDPGSGATFSFPGGLDMANMALASPQLVVGSLLGTEAMVRYFAVDTGDEEIGDVSLFGLGVRHSISQYFSDFPVNLSALAFWQEFKMGDELIDAVAFTTGVQASKRFGVLEPYAGFSMDTFQMDVEYDSEVGGTSERVKVEFDTDTNAHLTLGSALRFGFFHVNGELNVSDQTSFTAGLGFGI